MTEQEFEFRLSTKIISLVEEFIEYTPPAGSTVKIKEFIAEGPYELASEARIVWDYGGDEEFLWTIKGSGRFGNQIIIGPEKTDGIKKLALVLDNGELVALSMSGYMIVVVS